MVTTPPDAPADIPVKSKKRYRILMMLSILGAVALKMGFVFFFVGMLPAMVAYIIDHDKQKYIFSTVAAFNLAGVFPDMMDIIMQGSSFDAVKAKLADAFVWLTMYSAAGMGWVLVWLSPLLAGMVLQGIYRGRIALMENMQKKLEEEWGPEVAERSRTK